VSKISEQDHLAITQAQDFKLQSVTDIKEAINKIRAKHKKAWRTIQTILADEMKPHLSDYKDNNEGIWGPLILPRVGAIIILRINSIVPFTAQSSSTQLNRLIFPKLSESFTSIQELKDLSYLFSLEDRLCVKLESVAAGL